MWAASDLLIGRGARQRTTKWPRADDDPSHSGVVTPALFLSAGIADYGDDDGDGGGGGGGAYSKTVAVVGSSSR